MAGHGKKKQQQQQLEGATKFEKSYFDVLGLCCTSEVPLIENILRSLDGVKDITVIVPSRTVIVVHDNLLISPLQIVKALNQARLEANVRVRGEENVKQKWPSPFALACGLLLLLSLFKYAFDPFKYLALASVAVGLFPIASKAFIALKNVRIDINILALIAVIGTVAMRDYFEAATIVFLFSIAEWLESRASHKANAVMSSLMSLAPQKAVIAESGEVVAADEVKLNTILAVKAGEVIPIDGIVVDGNCEVDEKTLTGESFPVPKQQDSAVWAGTINLNGYISVKTTALAEDCVVAKMAKIVEQAQNNKAKVQRFIDKCSKYYTPVIVIVSASVALIPVALRVHNLNHWFHFALVVLVSACPCALVLSTPVVTFCALTRAAKSGLLIKGGEFLEILAKIKIMAFDKTGTITRGEFIVTNFQSLCNDVSLNALVYWVSSIESKSSHPMADALVDYGRSLSIEPKPEDVEDFENFPGEGIHGRIDGKDIYIGNKRISRKAGCETVPEPEGEAMDGKTIGYIFCGGKLAGIFSLSDACRTGVAEAVKELKSLEVKTAMLTGDSQAAAMQAQSQLGNSLDIVRAELLPEDKAKVIKDFKTEGATAMVGDGLNDAPALATADVGISMGISGSALATETGHMILMSNDIRKIPESIRLARKARRKIIENVILSVATKGAILGLALAGHPLVWAAVLADVGTCLVVISNSMLLLGGTDKPKAKSCKFSSASHNGHKSHGCGSHKSHSSENKSHPCCDKNKCKDQETHKPQKCCSPKCGSGSHPIHHHLSSNHCEGRGCADSAHKEGNDPKCCDEDDCNAAKCCQVENQLNHGCSQNDHGVHFEAKECRHGSHHGVGEGQHSRHSSSRKCHSEDEHLKIHCQPKYCRADHTSIDIRSENEIMDQSSACLRACSRSLEKREMGGCCKSYMKECCRKHGHFGGGFEGGLSEIITE